MKMCFILRDYNDCGGIQQATCNLANSINENDCEITVLSLYNSKQFSFFQLDKKISTYCLLKKRPNLRFGIVFIKKKLKQYLIENNFDLIIVQGISYCFLVDKKIYKNTRVIVCEHTHFYNGRVFGLHWLGIQTALKYSSAIVCLTKLDAENYRRKSKRNIDIVSIGNFVQSPKSDSEYNIFSKTIVSCGSIIPVKGFLDIPSIFENLMAKHSDWKWVIYGDGTEKEQLSNLIKEKKLENNIVLAGYEKDKATIFENKALYVCTSRSEGFGITLLEAMSYKIPCVSFNVKYGPQELICDGYNGFLIHPFDVDEMSKKIDELLCNNLKRSTFGENAFMTFQKNTKEEVVKKWNKLLKLNTEER